MEKLSEFSYGGETLEARLVESVQVAEGVVCDVYEHPGTKDRDLGIITIQPGCKTPLQKVVSGSETIEGWVSGRGRLMITRVDGSRVVHEVDERGGVEFSCVVEVGEMMQWEADEESELVAFEICYPPYEPGRYENIEE
jgi:hypothetical protein